MKPACCQLCVLKPNRIQLHIRIRMGGGGSAFSELNWIEPSDSQMLCCKGLWKAEACILLCRHVYRYDSSYTERADFCLLWAVSKARCPQAHISTDDRKHQYRCTSIWISEYRCFEFEFESLKTHYGYKHTFSHRPRMRERDERHEGQRKCGESLREFIASNVYLTPSFDLAHSNVPHT